MKYVLILEDNRRAREALAEAVRGISRNVKVLEAENEEEELVVEITESQDLDRLLQITLLFRSPT